MSDFERYLEYDRYPQPHVILKKILTDKLIARAYLSPNCRFLDIGCGRGGILARMAELGH